MPSSGLYMCVWMCTCVSMCVLLSACTSFIDALPVPCGNNFQFLFPWSWRAWMCVCVCVCVWDVACLPAMCVRVSFGIWGWGESACVCVFCLLVETMFLHCVFSPLTSPADSENVLFSWRDEFGSTWNVSQSDFWVASQLKSIFLLLYILMCFLKLAFTSQLTSIFLSFYVLVFF